MFSFVYTRERSLFTPKGLFDWHYLQCVAKQLATEEYKELPDLYGLQNLVAFMPFLNLIFGYVKGRTNSFFAAMRLRKFKLREALAGVTRTFDPYRVSGYMSRIPSFLTNSI